MVKWKWYYNLLITFIISGLWHGANWTFIFWGLLHGLYLIFSFATASSSNLVTHKIFGNVPRLKALIDVVVTFILVYFAWVFFRAETIQDAFFIIKKILTLNKDISLFTLTINDFGIFNFVISIFSILILFIYEVGRHFKKLNQNFNSVIATSCILFILTLLLGVMGSKSFIYFQF
ncbi:MAG: hypothetical protein IPP71_23655 [Bacteroidetes bacterium]|nr:hypothetical protein [Bacteroidota bacterium]